MPCFEILFLKAFEATDGKNIIVILKDKIGTEKSQRDEHIGNAQQYVKDRHKPYGFAQHLVMMDVFELEFYEMSFLSTLCRIRDLAQRSSNKCERYGGDPNTVCTERLLNG
jgi:hypothetical protein